MTPDERRKRLRDMYLDITNPQSDRRESMTFFQGEWRHMVYEDGKVYEIIHEPGEPIVDSTETYKYDGQRWAPVSGIPIYPDKVKLPEWSEYDKGIMASCGIRP